MARAARAPADNATVAVAVAVPVGRRLATAVVGSEIVVALASLLSQLVVVAWFNSIHVSF